MMIKLCFDSHAQVNISADKSDKIHIHTDDDPNDLAEVR